METFHVRMVKGAVHDAGSWLYVWIPTARTEVVYVGGTGLHPLIRAWLHLHGEDPAVARVAHRYPAALSDSREVLAFRLADGVDRPSAKAELIRQLHSRSLCESE